jgi:RsiW-degrading membrane proteinase PrsW (M82 family)
MKLVLMVQSGALAGSQIQLEQGFILIGRGSDCNLSFQSDRDSGVSTHHAYIQAAHGGFYLTDQKSTNGTYVNGELVQEKWLRQGDVIQLGRMGPKIAVTIQSPQTATIPPKVRTFQNLGERTFYNPEKPKKESHYVKTAIGIGLAFIMIFIVTILMVANLGFEGAFVGSFMAFLPAPFYLFIYLWMDRYDPEPPWSIAVAFAWGGLFSILISFVVNTIFGSVAATFMGEPAGQTLSAVISAPFIEELTKGIGVALIALFLRKEFDGVLDGIVYAGVVGLGFATVENILYYGGTFVKAGGGGLLFIGFLRGVLSPFIHSFFTAMTGIGCGLARESHNKLVQIVAPILGFFGAMTLHALWNFSASLLGNLFFLVYFVVWVPLFLAFIGMILFIARREKKIMKRVLAVEQGGLLTREEIDLAGSIFNRIRWLMGSNSWKKYQARRKFLRAITRLAFCYWHVERALSARTETMSMQQIPQFRSEIAQIRATL